jgi:hypothetical protein
VAEPPATRILGRMFAYWWAYQPAWIVGLIAFDVALGFVSAYFIALTTLRVSFKDIRDVDALLDYYVRDFGFHPPRRSGDSLVFRATFWTFSMYSVLQLKARVSGNTVLLTGPAPVMRRLKQRMLLLAQAASHAS